MDTRKINAINEIAKAMIATGKILNPDYSEKLDESYNQFQEGINKIKQQNESDVDLRLKIFLSLQQSDLKHEMLPLASPPTEERVDKIFKYIKTGLIQK